MAFDRKFTILDWAKYKINRLHTSADADLSSIHRNLFDLFISGGSSMESSMASTVSNSSNRTGSLKLGKPLRIKRVTPSTGMYIRFYCKWFGIQ